MLDLDQIGHKQDSRRQLTWCLRAWLYTLFKIHPTRGADVLIEVLHSEFDGGRDATISRPIAVTIASSASSSNSVRRV